MKQNQEYSDEELVTLYKGSRDHQYLSELFTRHSGVLYRSAIRILKNSSNAEDVLQTAYCKMIKDLSTYKGTGSVTGWMVQVVIHTSYERIRSEKSRLNRERKVMAERPQSTPHKDDELNEMIEAHLKKLPEIYKVPITLKIMEGLSIKEVSDALSIPEKTIRSQIERGLEKLKDSLQRVGFTASVISVNEMLAGIQKPTIPEIFKSVQYFNNIVHKKGAISTKVATAMGSKSSMIYYLMTFLILITTGASVLIGSYYFSKTPELVTGKNNYQKWNFENTTNISEYSNLGLLNGAISIVDSIGLNKSNVLKIEKDSLIEIDISKYQLPIKISYITDTQAEKLGQSVGFMQMVFKGNYKSDQKIMQISGIRENISGFDSSRNSNSKLNYFGKWFSFCAYIDEKSIDFYLDEQRSYYLQGVSHDNKKIYIKVKGGTIIDDLQIESIDKSRLPDKSKFEKICADFQFQKDKEYYDIEKEKLGLSNSLKVKPYLRLIRNDFFSLIKGPGNETIYPILSNNKVEWIKLKEKISKKWDFENPSEMTDFKVIKGTTSSDIASGIDNSKCLEIDADSVIEIDISKFELPLKITYAYDYLVPIAGDKVSPGIAVLKGNFRKDRNIFNFVKFKPNKKMDLSSINRNKNSNLGFVGGWEIATLYITEDGIDFYFSGKRTGLMVGQSVDNKKLYFSVMGKFLMDNFVIESIDVESAPSIKEFKEYSDSYTFEKGFKPYFKLENEKQPLNLNVDSLLELGIFDSETVEFNLGLNKSKSENTAP